MNYNVDCVFQASTKDFLKETKGSRLLFMCLHGKEMPQIRHYDHYHRLTSSKIDMYFLDDSYMRRYTIGVDSVHGQVYGCLNKLLLTQTIKLSRNEWKGLGDLSRSHYKFVYCTESVETLTSVKIFGLRLSGVRHGEYWDSNNMSECKYQIILDNHILLKIGVRVFLISPLNKDKAIVNASVWRSEKLAIDSLMSLENLYDEKIVNHSFEI